MNQDALLSFIGRPIESFDLGRVECVSAGPNEAKTHEACKYKILSSDGWNIYAITIDDVVRNATFNRHAANFFYTDALKAVDEM